LQLAAALHDFVSPIGLLIGGRAAGRHELADGPANRRPVGRVALHRSHPEIVSNTPTRTSDSPDIGTYCRVALWASPSASSDK
jgi:hypothetical protein